MADTPKVRGGAVRKQAIAHRPPAKSAGDAPITPTRIAAMEKQRRALELRKSGATYEQIAQHVGYADASGARKAIIRQMDQMVQEPTDELRRLNVERLNHMLLVLWPKIQAGDERSIDSGLRILDKLDRLMGTEAPQQVDHSVQHSGAVLVVEGDKDAYIAAMKRMAGIAEDGTNKQQSIEVDEVPNTGVAGAPVGGQVVDGGLAALPPSTADQHQHEAVTQRKKPTKIVVDVKEEDE